MDGKIYLDHSSPSTVNLAQGQSVRVLYPVTVERLLCINDPLLLDIAESERERLLVLGQIKSSSTCVKIEGFSHSITPVKMEILTLTIRGPIAWKS